jgi:hypothetical protein
VASRGARVEVEGRRELVRTMRAAGIDLGDLTKANRDAAAVVAPESAARTPRRTGRLAGTVKAAGTRSAALVRVGSRTVPYAGPIVFGWAAHNIEPNPGPVDALATTEPRWRPVYDHAIERIIAKIKGV